MPESTKKPSHTAHHPTHLSLPKIIKLTDAAQELFGTLYDLEKARKAASQVQLRAVLVRLDLLGLTVNRSSALAKEYQPS